jgi:hypothetical protein
MAAPEELKRVGKPRKTSQMPSESDSMLNGPQRSPFLKFESTVEPK